MCNIEEKQQVKFSFLSNVWYFLKWLMLGYTVYVLVQISTAYYQVIIIDGNYDFNYDFNYFLRKIRISHYLKKSPLNVLLSFFSDCMLVAPYSFSYFYYIGKKTKLRNAPPTDKSPFLIYYCHTMAYVGIIIFVIVILILFSFSSDAVLGVALPITIARVARTLLYSGILNNIVWPFINVTNKKKQNKIIGLMVIVNIIGLFLFANLLVTF